MTLYLSAPQNLLYFSLFSSVSSIFPPIPVCQMILKQPKLLSHPADADHTAPWQTVPGVL